MTQRTEQDQFVDALRDQWEAQVAREFDHSSQEFNGWVGADYNSWLAHRHGWPVTPEGWCGPSWASVLDEDEPHMEIPYTDCDICMDIVQQYEGEGVAPTFEPEGITIEKKHDGKVIMVFPEGVHLNHLLDSPGVEVILTRSQWREFTTAHTNLMWAGAHELGKRLKSEFLAAFKGGDKSV